MTESAEPAPARDPILTGIVVLGLVWFAFLAIGLRVWTPQDAVDRAHHVFSDASIDAAHRYLAPLRMFSLITAIAHLAFASSLILTSRWRGLAARNPLVVAAVLYLIDVAIGVPRLVYGWSRRSQWALTEQSFGDFIGQTLTGELLGLLVWLGTVAIITLVVKRTAKRGPWVLGALFAGFVLIMQVIDPLVIAPMFNTFTPIEQSKFAEQGPRVRALVEKAGLHVDTLLVMDGSRQGAEGNAYVAGLLGADRVVLYDTMLAYPPAEVDAIVGHELGHWKHGDVWKGTLAGAAVSFVAPFFLLALLRRNKGVPVAFVLFALNNVGESLTTPLWTVLSRHQEAAADAFSLDLTGDAKTFAEDERRLALESFSELVPHPLRVMNATHPPSVARVEMACARDPSVCDAAQMDAEVKVTVDAHDLDVVVSAVGFKEPFARAVTFHDTEDLALFKQGIVVRTRSGARGSDVTVKLTGARALEGGTVELDVVADKRTVHTSLTRDVAQDGLVLSDAQRALVPVDVAALKPRGPFATRVWKTKQPVGLSFPVTLEEWTLGGETLLEISGRVPERDVEIAQKLIARMLAHHGVRVTQEQGSKTERALRPL